MAIQVFITSVMMHIIYSTFIVVSIYDIYISNNGKVSMVKVNTISEPMVVVKILTDLYVLITSVNVEAIA